MNSPGASASADIDTTTPAQTATASQASAVSDTANNVLHQSRVDANRAERRNRMNSRRKRGGILRTVGELVTNTSDSVANAIEGARMGVKDTVSGLAKATIPTSKVLAKTLIGGGVYGLWTAGHAVVDGISAASDATGWGGRTGAFFRGAGTRIGTNVASIGHDARDAGGHLRDATTAVGRTALATSIDLGADLLMGAEGSAGEEHRGEGAETEEFSRAGRRRMENLARENERIRREAAARDTARENAGLDPAVIGAIQRFVNELPPIATVNAADRAAATAMRDAVLAQRNTVDRYLDRNQTPNLTDQQRQSLEVLQTALQQRLVAIDHRFTQLDAAPALELGEAHIAELERNVGTLRDDVNREITTPNADHDTHINNLRGFETRIGAYRGQITSDLPRTANAAELARIAAVEGTLATLEASITNNRISAENNGDATDMINNNQTFITTNDAAHIRGLTTAGECDTIRDEAQGYIDANNEFRTGHPRNPQSRTLGTQNTRLKLIIDSANRHKATLTVASSAPLTARFTNFDATYSVGNIGGLRTTRACDTMINTANTLIQDINTFIAANPGHADNGTLTANSNTISDRITLAEDRIQELQATPLINQVTAFRPNTEASINLINIETDCQAGRNRADTVRQRLQAAIDGGNHHGPLQTSRDEIDAIVGWFDTRLANINNGDPTSYQTDLTDTTNRRSLPGFNVTDPATTIGTCDTAISDLQRSIDQAQTFQGLHPGRHDALLNPLKGTANIRRQEIERERARKEANLNSDPIFLEADTLTGGAGGAALNTPASLADANRDLIQARDLITRLNPIAATDARKGPCRLRIDQFIIRCQTVIDTETVDNALQPYTDFMADTTPIDHTNPLLSTTALCNTTLTDGRSRETTLRGLNLGSITTVAQRARVTAALPLLRGRIQAIEALINLPLAPADLSATLDVQQNPIRIEGITSAAEEMSNIEIIVKDATTGARVGRGTKAPGTRNFAINGINITTNPQNGPHTFDIEMKDLTNTTKRHITQQVDITTRNATESRISATSPVTLPAPLEVDFTPPIGFTRPIDEFELVDPRTDTVIESIPGPLGGPRTLQFTHVPAATYPSLIVRYRTNRTLTNGELSGRSNTLNNIIVNRAVLAAPDPIAPVAHTIGTPSIITINGIAPALIDSIVVKDHLGNAVNVAEIAHITHNNTFTFNPTVGLVAGGNTNYTVHYVSGVVESPGTALRLNNSAPLAPLAAPTIDTPIDHIINSPSTIEIQGVPVGRTIASIEVATNPGGVNLPNPQVIYTTPQTNFQINPTGLVVGASSYTIRYRDDLGRRSPTQDFTLNNTPPLLAAPSIAPITVNEGAPLTTTLTPPAGVNPADITGITIITPAGTTRVLDPYVAGALNRTFTITSPLGVGPHNLTVSFTTAAGTSSPAPLPIQINAAPIAPPLVVPTLNNTTATRNLITRTHIISGDTINIPEHTRVRLLPLNNTTVLTTGEVIGNHFKLDFANDLVPNRAPGGIRNIIVEIETTGRLRVPIGKSTTINRIT